MPAACGVGTADRIPGGSAKCPYGPMPEGVSMAQHRGSPRRWVIPPQVCRPQGVREGCCRSGVRTSTRSCAFSRTYQAMRSRAAFGNSRKPSMSAQPSALFQRRESSSGAASTMSIHPMPRTCHGPATTVLCSFSCRRGGDALRATWRHVKQRADRTHGPRMHDHRDRRVRGANRRRVGRMVASWLALDPTP